MAGTVHCLPCASLPQQRRDAAKRLPKMMSKNDCSPSRSPCTSACRSPLGPRTANAGAIPQNELMPLVRSPGAIVSGRDTPPSRLLALRAANQEVLSSLRLEPAEGGGRGRLSAAAVLSGESPRSALYSTPPPRNSTHSGGALPSNPPTIDFTNSRQGRCGAAGGGRRNSRSGRRGARWWCRERQGRCGATGGGRRNSRSARRGARWWCRERERHCQGCQGAPRPRRPNAPNGSSVTNTGSSPSRNPPALEPERPEGSLQSSAIRLPQHVHLFRSQLVWYRTVHLVMFLGFTINLAVPP
jgi:hypothetical protein